MCRTDQGSARAADAQMLDGWLAVFVEGRRDEIIIPVALGFEVFRRVALGGLQKLAGILVCNRMLIKGAFALHIGNRRIEQGVIMLHHGFSNELGLVFEKSPDF